MIIRTIGESIEVNKKSLLLEYLGIKKDLSGIQKVTQNIELIASVPFCLSEETK